MTECNWGRCAAFVTAEITSYGSQGHSQSLDMCDNGLNIIFCVRENGER